MINNRPSWDKPTRKIIISQLEKLCLNCGGFFVRGSCIRCKGTRFVEVMEHEAAAWRAEIAEANRLAIRQAAYNGEQTERLLGEWELSLCGTLNQIKSAPVEYPMQAARRAAFVAEIERRNGGE